MEGGEYRSKAEWEGEDKEKRTREKGKGEERREKREERREKREERREKREERKECNCGSKRQMGEDDDASYKGRRRCAKDCAKKAERGKTRDKQRKRTARCRRDWGPRGEWESQARDRRGQQRRRDGEARNCGRHLSGSSHHAGDDGEVQMISSGRMHGDVWGGAMPRTVSA